MMHTRVVLFLVSVSVLFLFLAGGCDGFPLIPPTKTPTLIPATATPTPTPTATKIWFPATDTPQPGLIRFTATPTQDQRPLAGEILFSDDFEQQDRWNISTATYGSVAYGNGELTIALKENRRSLYTFFLEPVPADYYLDVTINPSLCKGEDMYGIAFRTQSDSQFYRFVMQCDGQLRIDLVQGNSAVPIQTLQSSGAFRPGPLQELHVSLWLYGDEVRVFVNDVYQMNATPLRWLNGGVGFFARSYGENALTVNFSDLTGRESVAFPPTPIPSETPLPSATHTPLKQP